MILPESFSAKDRRMLAISEVRILYHRCLKLRLTKHPTMKKNLIALKNSLGTEKFQPRFLELSNYLDAREKEIKEKKRNDFMKILLRYYTE